MRPTAERRAGGRTDGHNDVTLLAAAASAAAAAVIIEDPDTSFISRQCAGSMEGQTDGWTD